MKKIVKFILPAFIVPLLGSCGGNNNGTHYVTFHQELAEDVKIEFNKDTTDGEIIAQEPKIVAKDGYDAKWEDYTIVGKTKDFTVNAIYSEYTYTVTFKQKGLVIDTVPFTASDVKGEHPQLPAEKVPACPSDTWYTYKWEDYELKLGNVVVNAVSTGEVEHIAKFTDGDKVIAEGVKFGRNDVDNNGCLNKEKIPDKVKLYVHDSKHPTYWDNNWDFKIPTSADINVTFDANVTKHQFPIAFLDHIGDLIEERTYDCETNWATMSKPDVSGYEGYDCVWPKEHQFSFNQKEADKVQPISVARKHILTFEGKSETQEVTYDSPFTLKYESDTNGDLKMWYDQDGNPVPTSGDKWKIDKDLTLHLEEVKEVNFDNGYLPRFMSTQAQTSQLKANNLAIVDNPNGGKMLEITVNNSDDSSYLILSKEYMAQVFGTDGINAIKFDAKATKAYENFRTHYKANVGGTSPGIKYFNNTYEGSATVNYGYGVASDHFKTFSFNKVYYQEHMTYETTGDGLVFIYGNFAEAGVKVYVDNIRLDTNVDVDYKGFENGGLKVSTLSSGAIQYFYSGGGRGDNRVQGYLAPVQYFFMAMDEKGVKSNAVTLSDDVSSNGGIASLKIEKTSGSGAFPMYIQEGGYGSSHKFPDFVESVTFDIYSTVAYNGNSVKDGKSGTIPGFGTSDTHEANKWYTMTIPVSSTTATDDARFMYIVGGVVGDFYIDNVIVNLKS